MRYKLFSLALVAAAIASPAFAADQVAAMAGAVTQADVGRFIRDQSGEPIGSLRAVHGNEAVVWYGFVNTPGNHLATVPLNAITASGGRLVLSDNPVSHLVAR